MEAMVPGCHSFFFLLKMSQFFSVIYLFLFFAEEVLGSGMLRGAPGASTSLKRMPATETDLTPDGVLEYGVMEYDSPAP